MSDSYLFARMPILSAEGEAPFAYEILLRNWRGISLSVFNLYPSFYTEFSYPMWLAIFELDSAKKCRREGQKLFVNMTLAQLLSDGSLQFLTYLDSQQLRLSHYVIELTEHDLANVPGTSALIDRMLLFKCFGCQFAIDDFDSQFSNFNRVFALKPNYLKIDRHLIVQAGADIEQQQALNSLVKFCHEQSIQVIIEGVETKAHLDIVNLSHADFCQGFYIGLPEPILTTSINLIDS